ncbi:MAG: DUF4153 domain-containing protein [Clostridia bacterium]|nr:DUF4153 domain-containing protein [Clostridia bacterium]
MNRFVRSVVRVVTGGAKAFFRYPASMFYALVLAAAASVRIAAEPAADFEKLLVSIQTAAVLGVFLGMTATAHAVSGYHRRRAFVLVNLGAALIAAGVAAYLYLAPGDLPPITGMRVYAGAAVSLLLFLLILSRRDQPVDYSDVAFISLRSFFIAAIYTLVLLGGLNFIAFAIKSLIVETMSDDVYAHVSVWSAFAGYSFFLGYLPDFTPEDPEDRLESVRRHPVFIEILLAYVVIPLITVMTLVLLIWAGRILVLGELPEFGQIAAIFSSYAVVGIAVTILTDHYTQATAVWFRRLFPPAAVLFLAFEGYAIYDRITAGGLKTTEYLVILIALYALLGAVALMLRPVERHRYTGWIAAFLIAVAVLPAVGYVDLPAWTQGNRLTSVLNRNSMLAGSEIRKAPAAITMEDKEIITDAVDFLYYEGEDGPRPSWLSASLTEFGNFQRVFGFAPTYPGTGPIEQPETRYLFLQLPTGSIDPAGYGRAISVGELWGDPEPIAVEGKQGDYTISLSGFTRNGDPAVVVRRGGSTVIEPDLTEWLQALALKYKDYSDGKTPGTVLFDDLVFRTESGGVRLMIVFRSIEAVIDSAGVSGDYFLTVSAIYFGD